MKVIVKYAEHTMTCTTTQMPFDLFGIIETHTEWTYALQKCRHCFYYDIVQTSFFSSQILSVIDKLQSESIVSHCHPLKFSRMRVYCGENATCESCVGCVSGAHTSQSHQKNCHIKVHRWIGDTVLAWLFTWLLSYRCLISIDLIFVMPSCTLWVFFSIFSASLWSVHCHL